MFDGIPQGVPAGTFSAVSTASHHACAIASDASVACWGRSNEGEATPPAGSFKAVSASNLHTCAISDTNQVVCWGWNFAGATTPPAGKFSAIAAGSYNTCGIRLDGTLSCWGDDSDGSSEPPPGTFTAVGAGNSFACAIRTDSALLCWGFDGQGQTEAPPGAYKSVAVGGYHACGTRVDGLVACWGRDDSGQTDIPVPLNSPPTTPGPPALATGTSPSASGVFSVAWSPSSDPNGDAITYALDRRNASFGAEWQSVNHILADPSYGFGVTTPSSEEGTWSFRVNASDGQEASDFASATDLVKVDTTPPSQPTIVVDRPADYTAGADWWRDTVTARFVDNGDPNLADRSAGSGIDAASLPSAVTFTSSGVHSVSGSVADLAGNISNRASREVRVDATPPRISIGGCPVTDVVVGTPLSLTVAAQDGESGLVRDPSGAVAVDTGTLGLHGYSAAVDDNVGHHASASCSYRVVLGWGGFEAPVNGAAVNALQIQSGRAVPIRFSLTNATGQSAFGSFGLNILAAVSPNPYVVRVDCGTLTGVTDQVDYTVSADKSGLTYDAMAGRYSYIWKTDKAVWPSGTCVSFNIAFVDGTTRSLLFSFK